MENEISIKVGDVTLSTGNVPKNGIDLSKLSDKTQQTLSIFDTNKDGKLSKREIKNAIVEFALADKTYTTKEEVDNKTITTRTRRDGVVDDYELENNIGEKVIDRRADVVNIIVETTDYTREEAEAISAQLGEGSTRYEKRKLSAEELKVAAKTLQKTIAREEAIQKRGLRETNNEDWLKDAENNHYRYNERTLKFEKIDNVEFVAEDGSYRTVKENGKKIVRKADDSIYQVRSEENKNYTNVEIAAREAGLTQHPHDSSLYVDKKAKAFYTWNQDSHSFERQNLALKIPD